LGDLVTIEGSNFANSSGKASSGGASIGSASGVAVFGRCLATKRIEFNALTINACVGAPIYRRTDLGIYFYAVTGLSFASSISKAGGGSRWRTGLSNSSRRTRLAWLGGVTSGNFT